MSTQASMFGVVMVVFTALTVRNYLDYRLDKLKLEKKGK